jgi:type II restriction enzyme
LGDDPSRWKLGFAEEHAIYESGSQSARVRTEGWIAQWMYCPSCGADHLRRTANNTPARDFECESCDEPFEIKSQKSPFGARVTDGAYETMRARIAAKENASFILMNYDAIRSTVTNLIVIPRHFFTLGALERRKPLAPTAKRAGWVGCNILLSGLPAAARIPLMSHDAPRPRDQVLAHWRRTQFLADQSLQTRRWLSDVLRCAETVARPEFTLVDMYAFESHFAQLYPNNRHVRQKIRQQLQVLRDHGLIEFLGAGAYRLRDPGA